MSRVEERMPQSLIGAPPGTEVRTRFQLVARVWQAFLGLPKTLVFNLRYLPLRQALRLPVLVSHRVALVNLGGSVTVEGPLRPGTVLLGFGSNGAFDFRRSRSVWQVAGDVVFEGPARLGHGFKLSTQGDVTFGADFVLSAESQILCFERMRFGRGCLISFDVLIMDSNFHQIGGDGEETPVCQPVTFGDRVWVGARATVLAGVELAGGVVVAAGAMVTGPEETANALLAGNPARVVRTGVRWRH